ncbi:MAG: TfoX/Sxy family protein [Ruminococcus sp.]|nr:TfoX/Sxy family protein [Ruminococcus sp.]
MASSKEYLDFILEQLSPLDDITFRKMMGEYIIYYRGRIIGGIYDDRFLVKPVKPALAMMPDAEKQLPYEGAKEMLLVSNVDDREFMCSLLDAMFPELPAPKSAKKKK